MKQQLRYIEIGKIKVKRCCRKCGEEKELNNENFTQYSNGYSRDCMSCEIKFSKKYRERQWLIKEIKRIKKWIDAKMAQKLRAKVSEEKRIVAREKRRKLARKYHQTIKNNLELWKKILDVKRDRRNYNSQTLSDTHIKVAIRANNGLLGSEITKEIIQMKREQLLAFRLCKKISAEVGP